MEPWTSYGQVWLSLTLGSVVGVLLMAPPIVLRSQSRLNWQIGRTIETGGMLLAAVESLHRDGAVVETPEMEVRYTSPKESLFWKD